MAGPGDKAATGKSRDRGRLRASDSEREQVSGALQAAFVQGRLTLEELGARAEQAYAAKTYADLTEVIADLPTELTGTRSQRAPWRATKRAWWFEYAVFLPGIVAIILLPGGPGTTIWTLFVFLAVMYPVFWTLGVFKVVAARHAKPAAGQQAAQLPWHEREQATAALKTALAQGRLTQDEHDTRAAQIPAARLGADLAALTADLPDGLNARLPKTRDAWTGLAVTVAAAGVLALLLLFRFDDFLAFATALCTAAILLLVPPITVGLMIDARHQKRTGGQLRLGPNPSASR